MYLLIFFKIKQYCAEKLFFVPFFVYLRKMNLNEVCSQHVVGVHLILIKLIILVRRAGYGRGQDLREVIFSSLQAYNIYKKQELIKEN